MQFTSINVSLFSRIDHALCLGLVPCCCCLFFSSWLSSVYLAWRASRGPPLSSASPPSAGPCSSPSTPGGWRLLALVEANTIPGELALDDAVPNQQGNAPNWVTRLGTSVWFNYRNYCRINKRSRGRCLKSGITRTLKARLQEWQRWQIQHFRSGRYAWNFEKSKFSRFFAKLWPILKKMYL
jgi:hypothetical protein